MDFKTPKELIRLAKESIESYENYWKQLNLQEDYDRLKSLEERTKATEDTLLMLIDMQTGGI